MRVNSYHPLNAGWMNLFRRWSMVPALRRYWPVLRHEFSREFVKFCENWAMFSHGDRTLHPVSELSPADRKLLLAEFAAEWPDEPDSYRQTMALGDWLPPEKTNNGKRNDPEAVSKIECWFVRVTTKGESAVSFVAGVIGLRPIGPATCSSTGESKDCYELLIWVRPQFREHGIGQWMIENLEVSERLDKIRDSKMNIILRYPLKSWIGQGRQIAKARWLSYFDFYGFRRPSTQTGATINTIAHFNGVRHDTTYWKSFEVLVFKPDPDK